MTSFNNAKTSAKYKRTRVRGSRLLGEFQWRMAQKIESGALIAAGQISIAGHVAKPSAMESCITRPVSSVGARLLETPDSRHVGQMVLLGTSIAHSEHRKRPHSAHGAVARFWA